MSDLKTPSETLAGKVVESLIGAGLLRADKREQLVSKIATGVMKGEDWKLEIDLANDKGAKP